MAVLREREREERREREREHGAIHKDSLVSTLTCSTLRSTKRIYREKGKSLVGQDLLRTNFPE